VQRELFPPRAVQPGERDPDEPGLLAALRRGDPEAFERLVRAYQHRVFGVALRMLGSRGEAEEIAQEVFLRVHRSVGGFRGAAKLSTWLYAIASRLCLNRLRAPERRRRGEAAWERVANGHANPGARLEAAELEDALRRAIAALDEERRIVVILRDLEGLAYEEIAAALGLPLNTVRSRLHRARMELKERLAPYLP
jgi:RNA polymerase sigma-70 factor (ECF subfamily)